MSDQGGAQPVGPIRHRLAVRPVLVSLSVRPKHPQGRLDKNANVAPDNARRQAKSTSSKSKSDKREKGKVTVESSKRDAHFLVQIPYGPVVRVPVGIPYFHVQHGNYKYSLLVDPATGKIRHVRKKAA